MVTITDRDDQTDVVNDVFIVIEEQVPVFAIHHDFCCCVIHHYAESKATLPVRTGFIVDLYFGFHLATSLVISICDGCITQHQKSW
jgi:hypothetical protein